MEVWLTEYRLAKAGKATDKSLRLLNEFDIFDHVEKLLSDGQELGKRGRGDDGFLERLN